MSERVGKRKWCVAGLLVVFIVMVLPMPGIAETDWIVFDNPGSVKAQCQN